MSFVGKSSVVLICLGVLSPVALAQKNITKTLKAVVTKPVVLRAHPPLLKAGRIPPVSLQLQQSFMKNWDLALEENLERNVALQHHKEMAISTVSLKQRKQYVTEKMQLLKDFVATHQNNWPRYGKSKQDNYVLRYILHFMEVQNPTPQVAELQREIIRFRRQTNARSPYEIASIVGSMMEYGLVPARVRVGEQENSNDVEITDLAEDLAFAMAASQVSMKNNPWKKISGFKHMADVVSTYYAMRRQDVLLEGIPETYIGESGIHYPNVPLLTKEQYLVKQNQFATEHPFEFVLAPFWEKVFHSSFYRIFNTLSPVQKQAILLTAPKLPQAVNVTPAVFAACYNNALGTWIAQHGREPNIYTTATDKLQRFLTDPQSSRPFRFRLNEEIRTFIDLPNEQQVEVLMWIWKNWQISPAEALKRFEMDYKNFF